MEDLTGYFDRSDDSGETFVQEHDVGGTASGIGRSLDGDTAVCALERGCVVHSVTGHGGEVAAVLKHLNDLVFLYAMEKKYFLNLCLAS